MTMFLIRTAVRVLARMSDLCFTCMQPKIYCSCRGKR